MDNLGKIIRKLRTDNKLSLRVVAAYLDMDQAILSKIEHGKRKPNREQVLKMAEYFKVEKDNLLVAWMADKVLYELGDDELALQALRVAEQTVSYQTAFELNSFSIVKKLSTFFMSENRVSAAWLFGSVARNEAKANSDIDVMVELNNNKRYSMMDLLDIQYKLQQLFNRKVDVVEKGYLKPFAEETVEKDLKLIISK
jgi:predicted nucleotidyltransferase